MRHYCRADAASVLLFQLITLISSRQNVAVLKQFRGCSRAISVTTEEESSRQARDEVCKHVAKRSPQEVPPSRPTDLNTAWIKNIFAYKEQNDVAPRATSLDNLPRINQRREVETDAIHL